MYGHVITKFSRMGSLPHFLTHGAPLLHFKFSFMEYKILGPAHSYKFTMASRYHFSSKVLILLKLTVLTVLRQYWTIGKIIDKIAVAAKLKNENNVNVTEKVRCALLFFAVSCLKEVMPVFLMFVPALINSVSRRMCY